MTKDTSRAIAAGPPGKSKLTIEVMGDGLTYINLSIAYDVVDCDIGRDVRVRGAAAGVRSDGDRWLRRRNGDRWLRRLNVGGPRIDGDAGSAWAREPSASYESATGDAE